MCKAGSHQSKFKKHDTGMLSYSVYSGLKKMALWDLEISTIFLLYFFVYAAYTHACIKYVYMCKVAFQ